MIYPGQSEYALGSDAEGVSFDVSQGELFALLGPSGCGKTTTLRVVGGFIPPTTGEIQILGKDVTMQPAHARATNTVFQGYALFPHMNVGGNVGFGLSVKGTSRMERRTRVAEALDLVGLGGLQDRRVSELSGGQAQRAALARAIINRPAVLLLDEPLGALDLLLRKQMQDEIVRLKESTGVTFVHVTHDQEEACAIADRIAVMREGRIVQVDTPLGLYRAPRTAYVATFIDAGAVVTGNMSRKDGCVRIASDDVEVVAPETTAPDHAQLAAVLPHDRMTLRPTSSPGSSTPNQTYGTVQRLVFNGSTFDAHVAVSSTLRLRATLDVDRVSELGSDVQPGAPVAISWQPEDVILVAETEPIGASELGAEPNGQAGL
jgi:ABC-type Fe3+/spermidine/putrescine transport system ATPase subunit